MSNALTVSHVGKAYKRYPNKWARALEWVSRRPQHEKTWVLKDIDFSVKPGEAVGIIGVNGAGKSTLLKIITGTTQPTTGSVQSSGRVAALLELGMGFHPDFTGRQNVFMAGQLLGLSQSEIAQHMPAIEAFAEIGEYIDRPVRLYSSGMQMRLAFSVATAVRPDLLIVDEALSVGDELFQRKCFSRIEAIRKAGATILFVSHSGGTVVELCDRAVLLDAGELLAVGRPKQIVGRYQKLLYAPADRREKLRDEIRRDGDAGITYHSDNVQELSSPPMAPEAPPQQDLPDSYDPALQPASTIAYASYGAIIHDPVVYTEQGERVNNLTRGKNYRYSYRVRFEHAASNVRFGMLIKTISGVELGGAASASSNRTSLPFVRAGDEYTIEFEFCCRLNAGIYFLNAGVVGDLNGSETYLHRLIDIAMFRVMSESENLSTGIIDFTCMPRINLES